MLDRYVHFVGAMRRGAAAKMNAILNPLALNPAETKANCSPSH